MKRPIALIALILASFSLMIVELRSPDRISATSEWTLAVFAPLFEAGAWSADRLRGGFQRWIDAQAASDENERLRMENAILAMRIDQLNERVAKLERERTKELPTLPDTVIDPLYANVIAYSEAPWDHTLIIDRGELDGVRAEPPMPVVDYSGAVVGQVIEAGSNSAKVRLLIDPGFQMGAIAVGEDSRDSGLLTGRGRRSLLRFRLSEPQKPLDTGMEVISSGFKGSLYPKGLRIGEIVQFQADKSGLAYAEVRPFASFESLEEVVVIEASTESPRPIPEAMAPVDIDIEAPVVPPAATPEDTGPTVEEILERLQPLDIEPPAETPAQDAPG